MWVSCRVAVASSTVDTNHTVQYIRHWPVDPIVQSSNYFDESVYPQTFENRLLNGSFGGALSGCESGNCDDIQPGKER